MTPELREKLKDYAESATPGPWEWWQNDLGYEITGAEDVVIHSALGGFDLWVNSRLAAACDPPTVLALLSDLEDATARAIAAEAVVREMVEALKDLRKRFHRALVHTGSDPEFADAACENADQAIARAEALGVK